MNPRLCLLKVQARNVHRIRWDGSKYDLVDSSLDKRIVSEVANILWSNLTDSAEQQLHKLLIELEIK